MSERIANRRLYAAMLRRQPVEGGDGGLVGQDNSNLPPLGDVGGLALGAGLGLGLGHGSAADMQVVGLDDLVAGEQLAVVDGGVLGHAVENDVAAEGPNGAGSGRGSSARAADVVGAGGNGVGFVSGHGAVSGLVGESSHVTSDDATTVRRPACHNRPARQPTYRMQSGWVEYGNVRVARMVDVPNVFEDRCVVRLGSGIGRNGENYAEAHGYDCTGCRWFVEVK